MAGSNNFQQWNPDSNNQETDLQYTSDAQRSGGASVDSPLPSPTANKLFYQMSTMMTALALAMAAKGYNVSDTNLVNLQTVLQNLLTSTDLAPYAPLNNAHLTGEPTAPNPAYTDNTTDIATMAAVNGQPKSLAANGYVKFGFGLVIQWMIGPTDANTGEPIHTVAFPTAFPNACWLVLISIDLANSTTNADFFYQTFGWNQFGVNYQRQTPTGGSVGGATSRAIIVAIGF